MASSQTGGVKRPASAAALSATDKKARNDDGDHKYMSGFGNEFATEALEGALPVGQNSPQVVRASMLSFRKHSWHNIVPPFAVPVWVIRRAAERNSFHGTSQRKPTIVSGPTAAQIIKCSAPRQVIHL